MWTDLRVEPRTGESALPYEFFDNRFLVRQRPTLITSGRGVSAKGISPATSTTKRHTLAVCFFVVFLPQALQPLGSENALRFLWRLRQAPSTSTTKPLSSLRLGVLFLHYNV